MVAGSNCPYGFTVIPFLIHLYLRENHLNSPSPYVYLQHADAAVRGCPHGFKVLFRKEIQNLYVFLMRVSQIHCSIFKKKSANGQGCLFGFQVGYKITTLHWSTSETKRYLIIFVPSTQRPSRQHWHSMVGSKCPHSHVAGKKCPYAHGVKVN